MMKFIQKKLSSLVNKDVFFVEKFSFPDRDPIESNNAIEGKLNRFHLIAVFFLTTFVVSMALNLLFVFVLLYKADVIPYVSDGSTFGCLVPQIKTNGMR